MLFSLDQVSMLPLKLFFPSSSAKQTLLSFQLFCAPGSLQSHDPHFKNPWITQNSLSANLQSSNKAEK